MADNDTFTTQIDFGDLTDGDEARINITQDQRTQVDEIPFDTLVVFNFTDKRAQIKLNQNTGEIYYCNANGGSFILESKDRLFFSNLSFTNESGADATQGHIQVTYGLSREGRKRWLSGDR